MSAAEPPFFLPSAHTVFLALAGAAGLYFGLPNPNLHLPPLALVYPFCLYLLAAKARNGKEALRHGWLAGLAANAAGLYWLVFPMHDVAGIPMLLAAPTALLLHAFLACYAALTVFAMRSFRQYAQTCFQGPAPNSAEGGDFPQAPSKISLLRLLAAPVAGGLAFGGFELFSGLLFTGFPWLSLSTGFAFEPLCIQTAAFAGGYFCSALLAAAACLTAEAALRQQKARALALLTACALLAAMALTGAVRLENEVALTRPENDATTAENSAARRLLFIMVQGNIDQNQKWEPAMQKASMDHYIRLSRAELRAQRQKGLEPRLIVWPETAMPFYYPLHREYAQALRAFAAEENIWLAFGALGFDRSDPHNPEKLLNGLFLLPPTQQRGQSYFKQHLVPFGEYTPFSVNLPFLQDLLQGINFFAGESAKPLRLAPDSAHRDEKDGQDGLSLGALICYEAVFPELARKTVAQGATVLLNVSNDGWFRKSSAPLQHLAHAVLRAVEQNRPLIRATNTGISVVIEPHGRIAARIEGQFTPDALTAQVTARSALSLYHRLYPLPEIVLAVAALCGLAAGLAAGRRSRRYIKE